MNIIGKTITSVRPMTREEMEEYGWEDCRFPPAIIILNDGSKLLPSKDEERLDPGVFFIEDSSGTAFELVTD